MENENAVVVAPEVRYDLAVARAPRQVLAEATDAAKALQSIVSQRANAVKFNGKQYLTFEDYQVLGKFYGITAKIIGTEYIELDGAKGFLAKAEAISIQTGQVISAAESMCMNDEPNWQKKPLFQLRSMAQTRSAAKSLRNCLAWVAIMAGYEASVAEEMVEDGAHGDTAPAKTYKAPEAKPKSEPALGNTLSFIPDAVSVKSGEGKKGPWTKYGIKHGQDWFGTFDTTFGNIAEKARDAKTEITLTWKKDGDYKTITDLTETVGA